MEKYFGNFKKDMPNEIRMRQVLIWVANELARLVEIQKVRAKIEAGSKDISPETVKELKKLIEEV